MPPMAVQCSSCLPFSHGCCICTARSTLPQARCGGDTQPSLQNDAFINDVPTTVNTCALSANCLCTWYPYQIPFNTTCNTPQGALITQYICPRFRNTGLQQLISVPVHHCADAHALVLTHCTGFKMVYSGDTEPCSTLQAAGRGATLLVHEATFGSCLEGQARRKRHSTVREAVAAAAAMGAYRTMLTHFSQRYARIPEELRGPALEKGARGIEADVVGWCQQPVVAFDGMVVPLTMLPVLPAVNAAVVALLHGVAEADA